MHRSERAAKKQLLKVIRDLEQNPDDKIRILGDVGITIVGAGLGAAAAATIAGVAGATTLGALTTVAAWAGIVTVGVTPVGWIIGCGVAGAAAAYGVSRMIRGGGLSEGRKFELLQRYRDELRTIEMKETSGEITESDRTRFICSMRELIDKNVIPPDIAFRLIEQVEAGSLPISQAIGLLQEALLESTAPAALMPTAKA